MALLTFGTNATTSLSSLLYTRNPPSVADVATFNANVKNDQINGLPIVPGAFRLGLLTIPNRGVLTILPGDYVAYDNQGWPILVSANSIANGPWTHS
jgi:hypothetical protein